MLRRQGSPRHFRDSLAVGMCLALSADPAHAVALRVAAPVDARVGLDALFERATAAAATVTLPPAAATAASAKRPQGAAPAGADPFAARATANAAARRADAAAVLRGETPALAARYAALRAMTPRQKLESGRLDGARRDAYLALLERSADLRVAWDAETPIFMTGSDLGAAIADKSGHATPAAAATAFWRAAAPLLRLADPAGELRLVGATTDALGQTHLRYQQLYRGVEVWGRDAIVHVQPDGRVGCFGGRLAPTPTALGDVAGRLGETTAARLAAAAAGAPTAAARALDLQVYVDAGFAPTLAWRVRVEPAPDRVEDVFVDAMNGTLVHRTSRVASDGPVTGSGIDLLGQSRSLALYQVGSNFFNINTTKPMFVPAGSNIPQTVKGGIRVFDAQHGDGQQLFFSASTNANSWTGKAAHVSAAANASIVYDYYNTRQSRNSIDGAGGTIELAVNFKNNFNNAFWNGQFMIFGNGDGSHFSDLAAALDVTAHEMTHGVVEHTANLVYETQSGALNESFADVFGTCAEWFGHPGAGNWLVGEEITTPGTPNDGLRNMQDPAAANVAFGGQQPTRMSQFQNLANDDAHDHGGVHINSGITNRAFYLVATNAALGATDADRIAKAERIYYRALANYLTRTSQFIDCRLAVIRAAEDLYGGAGSPVALACAGAFDTVEIGNGAPSEPPPVLPPVAGAEYIGVTQASNGQLLRVKADFSQNIPVSSVGIFNKPTYTDDGQIVIFIDSAHKLRFAHTDGTNENFLSQAPVWRSIAVSPDGNTLAATSTALDDTIYVLDLSGQGADRAFAIHTVNYGGDGDDAAQYADFLDFSNDGRFVLYDAFNQKSSGSGTLEYWDINMLRASDGAVQRVFPPQAAGIDIGNPTFSPRSDFVIAFDYLENGNFSVLGANLEQGAVGLITNNFGSPGRPSFSPDATQVVYHFIDGGTIQLWKVSLQGDGITGAGDDINVATGGFDPVWFAVGTRSAVVLSGLAASRLGNAAHLAWEASADAAHDHFVVLRDAGNGYEPRSGALRDPVARGGVTDRWEYADDLRDVPTGTAVVRYAVQAVDRSGAARIAGSVELRLDAGVAPHAVRLLANSPNPFNPSTAIRFELGRAQPLRLDVYDAAGRRVRGLWAGIAEAGSHVRVWDGRDDRGASLASGIYVARLVAQDGTRSQKLTLMK